MSSASVPLPLVNLASPPGGLSHQSMLTEHETLHTPKSQTGYQPYLTDSYSLDEDRSRSPEGHRRSSSAPIRADSSNKRVKRQTSKTRGGASPTHPPGLNRSRTSSEGGRQQVFSDAEVLIMQKGREVAQAAADIQVKEHQVHMQQQAAAKVWELTQKRESDSQHLMSESQNAQAAAASAHAQVVAETAQARQQISSEAQDLIARAENERLQILAEQQRVEAERVHTLAIQQEVERQVALEKRKIQTQQEHIAAETQALTATRLAMQQQLQVDSQNANSEQQKIEAERQLLMSERAQMQQQLLVLQTKLDAASKVQQYSLQAQPQFFSMARDDSSPEPPEMVKAPSPIPAMSGAASSSKDVRPFTPRRAALPKAMPATQGQPATENSSEVTKQILSELAALRLQVLSRGTDTESNRAKKTPPKAEGSVRTSSSEIESECHLSLTSSIQRSGWHGKASEPDDHGDDWPAAVASNHDGKKRELDRIDGIPAYPTVAEFAGWMREVRYAFSSASADPDGALKYLRIAETWADDVLALPTTPPFGTLEMKFGKALRSILRGEVRREVATVEEQVLRKQDKLLTGRQIYCWIIRQFKRDIRLARPHILEEIAMIKVSTGKNALRTFKNRWDAAVERLVSVDGLKEGDDEHLYIHFKKNFLNSAEMSDSVAKVERSLPSSRVHTYKWMYQAVEARLETMRLRNQEEQRTAACKPDSASPLTPYVPDKGKGKGKGKDRGKSKGKSKESAKGKGNNKGKLDTKHKACPRLVSSGTCQYGEKCFYSHDQRTIAQAKKNAGQSNQKPAYSGQKPKSEIPCRFFKSGNCNKTNCEFSHSNGQNGAENPTGVAIYSCVAVESVTYYKEKPLVTETVSCPALSDVPDEHLANGHFPPLVDSCPICRKAHMTNAPAHKDPHPHGDERLIAEAFGDVVHIDVLFFNKTESSVEECSETDAMHKGLVCIDQFTNDIEFIPLRAKSTAEIKEALIQFGGHRSAIKQGVSDGAPELIRAFKDLGIAPFEATPGRSTSHGKVERANRTVLERLRPALAQSGLQLTWSDRCAQQALMIRRLQVCNEDGVTIYDQKHPGAKKPPAWAFGAKVDFMPTKSQLTDAKTLPRGKEGILVGYCTNPGGSWTGDYFCVDLTDFKRAGGRTPRVFRTKSVTWRGDSRPVFPLYEALLLMGPGGIVPTATDLDFNMDPSLGEDKDEEPAPGNTVQEMYEQYLPRSIKLVSAVQKHKEAFQMGGWFFRVPKTDPSEGKPPNAGSRRPRDIGTITWAGLGQSVQKRELNTRKLEEEGHGPPKISEEEFELLDPFYQTLVLQARERHIEFARKMIERIDNESDHEDDSRQVLCSAVSVSQTEYPAVSDKETSSNTKVVEKLTNVEKNEVHASAWPEGQETLVALEKWCKEQGVPPPHSDQVGHRENVSTVEPLGFGLVTRPVPPGAPEWKSTEGQNAIKTEWDTHVKRGTWDMSTVREMSDVLAESHSSGNDVIIGGIHPILGAKGAESDKPVLRCRYVFTAPRAWTASGLDVNSLYQEVASSPITFQGSRTLRAYAALKGYEISTRDVKSAYLQSKLRREGHDDPITWVALPQQFHPPEWSGMRKPVVELVLSLYGHPVSGNRWEGKLDKDVKQIGFSSAPGWRSVYRNMASGAGLGVYVDDIELVASKEDTPKIWAQLEKHMEFGDEYEVWNEKGSKHLGCHYTVERMSTKAGSVETTIRAAMPEYFIDTVRRFEERTGEQIKDSDTPWLDSGAEKRYKDEQSKPGKYAWIAASPLMAGLYGARAARPDLIISTLRNARNVHRWTAFDDRKLIKYLGYLRKAAHLKLTGTLSTEDDAMAVVRVWTDADLAGDPTCDAKSTSGIWVEIASACHSRSMPIHWGAHKQGGTADSTTVAELDAMHSGLKVEGLPIATLLEFLLQRPVHIEAMQDNTTALKAAIEGYSPKLRYLHRTRRIDLEWLKEVFEDERHSATYTPSEEQKADLLTKEMPRPDFEKRKSYLGIGAVNLRDDTESRYVVSGGYMLPSVPKRQRVFHTPGRDSWVIDTGSGHHLRAEDELTKQERSSTKTTVDEVKFKTANGVISGNRVCESYINSLATNVEARVLPSTPNVLSVGRLVEDGAIFHWDDCGAVLHYKDKVHQLVVQHGVPLLALAAIPEGDEHSVSRDQPPKHKKENPEKEDSASVPVKKMEKGKARWYQPKGKQKCSGSKNKCQKGSHACCVIVCPKDTTWTPTTANPRESVSPPKRELGSKKNRGRESVSPSATCGSSKVRGHHVFAVILAQALLAFAILSGSSAVSVSRALPYPLRAASDMAPKQLVGLSMVIRTVPMPRANEEESGQQAHSPRSEMSNPWTGLDDPAPPGHTSWATHNVSLDDSESGEEFWMASQSIRISRVAGDISEGQHSASSNMPAETAAPHPPPDPQQPVYQHTGTVPKYFKVPLAGWAQGDLPDPPEGQSPAVASIMPPPPPASTPESIIRQTTASTAMRGRQTTSKPITSSSINITAPPAAMITAPAVILKPAAAVKDEPVDTPAEEDYSLEDQQEGDGAHSPAPLPPPSQSPPRDKASGDDVKSEQPSDEEEQHPPISAEVGGQWSYRDYIDEGGNPKLCAWVPSPTEPGKSDEELKQFFAEIPPRKPRMSDLDEVQSAINAIRALTRGEISVNEVMDAHPTSILRWICRRNSPSCDAHILKASKESLIARHRQVSEVIEAQEDYDDLCTEYEQLAQRIQAYQGRDIPEIWYTRLQRLEYLLTAAEGSEYEYLVQSLDEIGWRLEQSDSHFRRLRNTTPTDYLSPQAMNLQNAGMPRERVRRFERLRTRACLRTVMTMRERATQNVAHQNLIFDELENVDPADIQERLRRLPRLEVSGDDEPASEDQAQHRRPNLTREQRVRHTHESEVPPWRRGKSTIYHEDGSRRYATAEHLAKKRNERRHRDRNKHKTMRYKRSKEYRREQREKLIEEQATLFASHKASQSTRRSMAASSRDPAPADDESSERSAGKRLTRAERVAISQRATSQKRAERSVLKVQLQEAKLAREAKARSEEQSRKAAEEAATAAWRGHGRPWERGSKRQAPTGGPRDVKHR